MSNSTSARLPMRAMPPSISNGSLNSKVAEPSYMDAPIDGPPPSSVLSNDHRSALAVLNPRGACDEPEPNPRPWLELQAEDAPERVDGTAGARREEQRAVGLGVATRSLMS